MATPLNISSPPLVAGADDVSVVDRDLADVFASLDIDDDDSDLILALKKLAKSDPKLVKSSEYSAPANPATIIRSWKMNEWKYYDIPTPFPTLARGLFTQEIKTARGQKKDRIVIRGYDKFFNIGEVPWTTWASLEAHTAPPYTLTLKSNGCIIFIAALNPSQLLVTSKHAIGPAHENSASSESHAQVGERWLRKHLVNAGKTERQLAHTLWEKNWTVATELCDDSFEEHVLPYSTEKTGLHLHGLNSCSGRFETQDQAVLDAFAREWGFIPTPSTVLPSIAAVRSFTADVARTGSWRGEAVEGFVVRTRVSTTPTPTRGGRSRDGVPSVSPYPPGASFFFKVKFDEPYMMYRDWREVTKGLLAAKPRTPPKSKMRRPETRAYVKWVSAEIARDKTQFADFGKGKGIIATRERFLRWLETAQGKEGLAAAQDGQEGTASLKGGKTIIMPVAIPGVGKTSVAVALADLFGFGHVQSDDFTGKKAANVFLKAVKSALDKHDVVIADKNNHLKQHRDGLRDIAKKFNPPAALLALHWPLELPLSTIHLICRERIVGRGERHQSLVADDAQSHEQILWMFLKGTEQLVEDEADVVVAMTVEDPLEDALSRAVGAVVEHLGLPQPDEERMGKALAAARAYESRTQQRKGKQKKEKEREEQEEREREREVAEQGLDGRAELVNTPTKSKSKAPRYFGIVAEVHLQQVVSAAFGDASGVPEAGRTFWASLVEGRRVQANPHVTIVHSKELPEKQELWDLCARLDASMFSFRLGYVVGNDRVIAVTVDNLAVEGDGAERDALCFVVGMPDDVKERLHITVGTRSGVLPVEAKEVVRGWKKNGARDGVWAVPLNEVWVRGRLKGLQS